MLRVSRNFISTIHRTQVVLQALRRPTLFCSPVFVAVTCMLQSAINIHIDSLMRRRRCCKLHDGLSLCVTVVFTVSARRRPIASYIADDRDLCLPHLHSTPVRGVPIGILP